MKKKLAWLLVTALLVQLFTGCGQEVKETEAPSAGTTAAATKAPEVKESETSETEAPGESGITYPIEGDNLTLTIAVKENANVTVVGKLEDTPLVKAYEEATGVNIEFVHPSDFALLFTSEKLPDIISYAWTSYPGGGAQAIEDGVILAVEDLIPTYAPDYYELLTSNDAWLKEATTTEGHLIGIHSIRTSQALCTSQGMIIRKDWLDDLGLDVPNTPEELTEALRKFRDEKGATAPMSMTYAYLRNLLSNGNLTSAFGLVKGNFYQKDGKVYSGYMEEGFKGTLAWLHELYVEGLLDPDFVTVDEATTKANLMNGISGVTCGGLAAGIGTMIQTMSPSNPEFNLIGVPSLVAKDGDRAYSGHCTATVNTTAAAISADCENVELALQFLNYAFTEEGRMLTNFGIEDVSYEMVDGQPKYTELITNNPNGLNITQALAQYANSGQNTMGIAIAQDERYIYEYSQYDVQDETLRLWTDNDAQKHLLPTLSVSDTELLAQINTEYYAYVGESISDFIKGTRSLDEFDDFVKELEIIGVPTMVDLYQEALDKYNAN